MAIQLVNVGTAPNDGTGDIWRNAWIKVNANLRELVALATPGVATVLDPANANYTISNSGLTVVNNNANNNNAAFSNTAKTTGKQYFEFRNDSAGGLVGVSANFAGRFGLLTNGFNGAGINTDISGRSTGIYQFNSANNGGIISGTPGVTGQNLNTGDIAMVAIDYGTGNLWVGRNGVWFTGDPALGTSPTVTGIVAADQSMIALAPGASGGQLTLRVRPDQFSYSIPSGYEAWDTVTQAATALRINTQTVSSYTIGFTDTRNTLLRMNNASANTITVPADAAVNAPIGTAIQIETVGTGATTIAPAGGVTINSVFGILTLTARYSSAMLVKVSANTWDLMINGLSAASVQVFPVAIGDELAPLTTGDAKITFRMPYNFLVLAIRASLTTAATGANLITDVNENGVSVFSTLLSIDAMEKTSVTAATPAVLSDTLLADDSEITVDIDQVGSTVAGSGLKIYIIGVRLS